MMYPQDAARLAATKLKTRKVRLGITVVISSLLFSVLFGASFLVSGVLTSLQRFNDAGFGNRYLVSAGSLSPGVYDKTSDQTLVAKAAAMEKDMQTKKTAEAKRLGIDYDPTTDLPYLIDGGFDGKTKQLNTQVPAVQQLIAQSLTDKPDSQKNFEATANAYGAIHTYKNQYMNNFSGQPTTNLSLILKGKEQTALSTNFSGPPSGFSTLILQWQLMSKDLLQPFIISGQNLDTGSDGSVPVIAPFSAAEEALGLKPLPATAKPKDKLARLSDVRMRAGGLKIQVCERNTTSAQDVSTADQEQQDIARNKGTKGYTLPDLVADKPGVACGPIVVTRDVRDADTKKLAAANTQFKREFGEPAPESHIVTLRIVGLNKDFASGSSASVVDIFQSLLSSTLGNGWYTPLESATKTSSIASIFDVDGPTQALQTPTYIAELPTAAATRKILSEQNCQPDFSAGPGTSIVDPYKKCNDQHKYFSFAPFGSSSTAIDEFRKGFTKVFKIAILIVVGIASLIMMGTVGRIIADSRRETAVFRAIGAKRLDISQIYITYTLLVSVLIGLVSLVVGLGLAEWLQARYSDQLTTTALLSFNVQDLAQRFHMVGTNARDLGYLVAAIVAVSLLATVLPLLNNMRRNPINDMRDER